jgi:hypothetical protein
LAGDELGDVGEPAVVDHQLTVVPQPPLIRPEPEVTQLDDPAAVVGDRLAGQVPDVVLIAVGVAGDKYPCLLTGRPRYRFTATDHRRPAGHPVIAPRLPALMCTQNARRMVIRGVTLRTDWEMHSRVEDRPALNTRRLATRVVLGRRDRLR